MDQTKTYVTILQESLERKERYLLELLELTKEQETIATQKKFDENAFADVMEKKDILIHNVNEIDKGFTSVYERVRTEVIGNQDVYRAELMTMQNLIRSCVDIGMQIEAVEERNRQALTKAFSKSFRGVKQAKQSRKAASQYYQNMANGAVQTPCCMIGRSKTRFSIVFFRSKKI